MFLNNLNQKNLCFFEVVLAVGFFCFSLILNIQHGFEFLISAHSDLNEGWSFGFWLCALCYPGLRIFGDNGLHLSSAFSF